MLLSGRWRRWPRFLSGRALRVVSRSLASALVCRPRLRIVASPVSSSALQQRRGQIAPSSGVPKRFATQLPLPPPASVNECRCCSRASGAERSSQWSNRHGVYGGGRVASGCCLLPAAGWRGWPLPLAPLCARASVDRPLNETAQMGFRCICIWDRLLATGCTWIVDKHGRGDTEPEGHELRVQQGCSREDIQEKIDRGKHGMARGARGAEPQDAQEVPGSPGWLARSCCLLCCLPPARATCDTATYAGSRLDNWTQGAGVWRMGPRFLRSRLLAFGSFSRYTDVVVSLFPVPAISSSSARLRPRALRR